MLHIGELPARVKAALLGPDTSASSLHTSSGGCSDSVSDQLMAAAAGKAPVSSGGGSTTGTSFGGSTSDVSDDSLIIQRFKLCLSQQPAQPDVTVVQVCPGATPPRPTPRKSPVQPSQQDQQQKALGHSSAVRIPTSLPALGSVEQCSPILLHDSNVTIPTRARHETASEASTEFDADDTQATPAAKHVATSTGVDSGGWPPDGSVQVPSALQARWTDSSSNSSTSWTSKQSQCGSDSTGYSLEQADDEASCAEASIDSGGGNVEALQETGTLPRKGSAARLTSPTLMEVLLQEMDGSRGSHRSTLEAACDVCDSAPDAAPATCDGSHQMKSAGSGSERAEPGHAQDAAQLSPEGDGSHAKLLQQLGQAFADLEQLVIRRLEVRKVCSKSASVCGDPCKEEPACESGRLSCASTATDTHATQAAPGERTESRGSESQVTQSPDAITAVPCVAYPTSSLGGDSHATSGGPPNTSLEGSRVGTIAGAPLLDNTPHPPGRLSVSSGLGVLTSSAADLSSGVSIERSDILRSRQCSSVLITMPLPRQQAPHATHCLDPDDGLPEGLICTTSLSPEDSRDFMAGLSASTASACKPAATTAPYQLPAVSDMAAAADGARDSCDESHSSADGDAGVGEPTTHALRVEVADARMCCTQATAPEAIANPGLAPVGVADGGDAGSCHAAGSDRDATSHHHTWGSVSHSVSSGGGSQHTASQQLPSSNPSSALPSAQASADVVPVEETHHQEDPCTDGRPLHQPQFKGLSAGSTEPGKLLLPRVLLGDDTVQAECDTIATAPDNHAVEPERSPAEFVPDPPSAASSTVFDALCSGSSAPDSSAVSQAGAVLQTPVVIQPLASSVEPVTAATVEPSAVTPAPAAAVMFHSSHACVVKPVMDVPRGVSISSQTPNGPATSTASVGVQTCAFMSAPAVSQKTQVQLAPLQPASDAADAHHVQSSTEALQLPRSKLGSDARDALLSKSVPEGWRPPSRTTSQFSPPRLLRAAAAAAYTSSSLSQGTASASIWLSPGRQRQHTSLPFASAAHNIRPPSNYPRTLISMMGDPIQRLAQTTPYHSTGQSGHVHSSVSDRSSSAFVSRQMDRPLTNIRQSPHSQLFSTLHSSHPGPALPAGFLQAVQDTRSPRDNIRPPPGGSRPLHTSWLSQGTQQQHFKTPPTCAVHVDVMTPPATLPRARAPAPETWADSYRQPMATAVQASRAAQDVRGFFAAVVQQDSGLGEVLGRPVTPQEEAQLKNLQDMARMRQDLSPHDKMKLWFHAERVVAARLGAQARAAESAPTSPTAPAQTKTRYTHGSNEAAAASLLSGSLAPGVRHHEEQHQQSPEKTLDAVLSRVHHAMAPNSTMALAMDREWVSLRQACSPGRANNSP